ncbi:MAG: glycosyltransferase family 39 protein [Anaerolineales bacterium]
MTSSKNRPGFPKVAPLLVLVVVVFLGLLLRSAFLQGPVFDQSLQISISAWELYRPAVESSQPDSGFGAQAVEFLREVASMPGEFRPLAVVLGLLYVVFGVSDLVSLLVPLLAFASTVVLVCLLARTWFGQATGILATLLWSVLPIGILLSVSLLPALPLTAGSLFAIYLFATAEQRASNRLVLASFFVLLIGLFTAWMYFLPTAVLLVSWVAWKKPGQVPIPMYRLFGFLILGFLFIPGIASQAVDVFYLILLYFENLLLLPLLALVLVVAAKGKQNSPVQFLLLWIGVKATFMVLSAPWLVQHSQFETIGMSGYWLDLILPGIILIAWQFTRRVGEEQVLRSSLIASFVVIAGLIVLNLGVSMNSDLLLTISRVSVGAAILLIFVYIAFWNINHRGALTGLLTAILITFVFASPSIVESYVESYRGKANGVTQVSMMFETVPDDKVAFIAGDALYQRFLYLNKYQSTFRDGSQSLSVYLLNQNQLGAVSVGSYVVISIEVLQFDLGVVPSNWMNVMETSNGERLLVYRIVVTSE